MKKGQKKNEPLDFVNKKFGRLLVENLHTRDDKKRYLWKCKCDCGNTKIVPQDLLTTGRTRSCGCLLIDAKKAKGNREDAILKIIYGKLIKRSIVKDKNGIPINYETFKNISYQNCFYCGIAPFMKLSDTRKEKNGMVTVSDKIIYVNGIDRVDSSKGYILENSVACCKYCNTAKNSMSLIDFKNHIIKIYEHWASK